MLELFLGGNDPLFGSRFTGNLKDFFEPAKLEAILPDETANLSIIYGCGAALVDWDGLVVYLDVPKNEIQFRARAGIPTNLGVFEALEPKAAYKRSYFVDWVALNAHKAKLLERMDVFVDAQRPDEITLSSGDSIRNGLERMSRNAFRARPWFEPGVWGGQWIKQHIPELPQDVPNYAWSFELITPENGLVFEADGLRLEVSFDCLMFQAHQNVLGRDAAQFGSEFPIRFDWLDTMDGGNLSVQCHPKLEYIRQHFGETITQDETYYILDCKPDSNVYLGFQEGVDPLGFRNALGTSQAQASPLEIERFVQKLPANKHDMFLIPNGTVHCSGEGCLVLEISATPYIFTFKMYDWVRLDLEGKPRPLNIARAFENLEFGRQGAKVLDELIAKPTVLEIGSDWRVMHLRTHEQHFYDVHRLEFEHQIRVELNGQCHVLAVVEGQGVTLETASGFRQRFAYAETFVVPAAAGPYTLENFGDNEVKVIKAFIKGQP